MLVGAVSGMGLVLLSGLSFGGLDAVRKRLAAVMAPEALVALLGLGQAPFFVAFWVMEGAARPSAAYALPACISVGLNLVANLLYVQAVRLSPLSMTVPFLALSPAFAALGAFVVLGERLSIGAWSGLGLVIVGALLLARRPGSSLWRALRSEPGSPRMIVVAACWATSTSVDKVALEHASVGLHALVQAGGVGILLLALLAFRGRLGELVIPRGERRYGLVLVMLATFALGLQLVALRVVHVGLLEAVKRALGTLMAFVFGHVAFGERPRGAQWAAMMLLVAGVLLLLLA
jgi:drug/metabolite transporter (DMT)-like permease